MLFLILASVHRPAAATGLDWPENHLLPSFSAPVTPVDCIDLSTATAAEADLFTSVQGIVNRTQPRIACVGGAEEGKLTWLTLHGLSYAVISRYSAITKYRTNFTGLVVTDPSQPDTLNLATTIAGLNNELICDPSLLRILTNAPYNLPILDDLRGRFSDKYQVYQYLYDNYWWQCSHRILAGMEPTGHGDLRDYIVAVKAAAIWLQPWVNDTENSILSSYFYDMTAAGGIYIGWWPDEWAGLSWSSQFGIPVLASDWYCNGTLFGGVAQPIAVPPIPPLPPLQNKVYVSIIISDGDNVQYMQHHMKQNWGNTARGSVPIGWTVSPLTADLDPGMLNYYWSTATVNDCLISGPSGAGYTWLDYWYTGYLDAFSRLTSSYLDRSGLRAITVWVQVTDAVANSLAANCPNLLGLTDQSGGNYTSVHRGLPTIGLATSYASTAADLQSAIVNAAAGWNGTRPLFIAVQGIGWNITPADCRSIVAALDPNQYVFVRPDHLFQLFNRYRLAPAFAPKAVTLAAAMNGTGATLQGMALPNGANTAAWFEWGLSTNYGQVSAATNLGKGYAVAPVTAAVSGLGAGRIYHYRLIASNSIASVRGADRQMTTGGPVGAWGDGHLGQTNLTGLTNVVKIACGASHGLALKSDRTLVAWGYNGTGQTDIPAGLTNVIGIAGGFNHSVALLADGTVRAWGQNDVGQTNVPAGATNILSVAANVNYTMALKRDGTVLFWGNYSTGSANLPGWLGNVVAIAGGFNYGVALLVDGQVVVWGDNSYGQRNVPLGLTNVVEVASGLHHVLALKADGTLVAWGRNNYGQATVPANLTNVAAIACGGYANLVLKRDGTLVSWGDNSYGQTNLPLGLTNIASVSGGMYWGAAIADQPPQALSQTVRGYINHDQLIQLTGSDADGRPLNYLIRTVPVSGVLYQVSDRARGAAIAAPGTPVSDPAGQVFFAPAPGEIGDPYAMFDFTANNGTLDSSAATVTVSVGLPAPPESVGCVSGGGSGDGTVLFSFKGTSNATYRVWASTNLSDWEMVGTAMEASPGQYSFRDSAATNWPSRFYRAGAP